MVTKIYDIIIVGAGPAGSTAGFYLAKNKKLKILIVDRFDFPREKACGGLLNNLDGLNNLENYSNIKKYLEIQKINNISFYKNNSFLFSRSYTQLFKQVERKEFDNLLLKECLKSKNIKFMKFNINRIEKEESYYNLYQKNECIKGKIIIGADGWNSIVSRFLGNKKREKKEYAVCYEHKIKCNNVDNSVKIFYFYQGEIGYSWLIPSSEGYYIGLGTVGKTKKPVTSIINDFFNFLKANNYIPKDSLLIKSHGAPVPIMIAKKYSSDTIFLCGDSLGTVKQPTGEGMYYAMLSGKILGNTIVSSLSDIEKRYNQSISKVIKEVTYFKFLPSKIFLKSLIFITSLLINDSWISFKWKTSLQNKIIKSFLGKS